MITLSTYALNEKNDYFKYLCTKWEKLIILSTYALNEKNRLLHVHIMLKNNGMIEHDLYSDQAT